MAKIKVNPKLKTEENSGFGNNSKDSGGRFFDNKQNRANVTKSGVNLLNRYSWYHTLIEMPFWLFLLYLLASYFLINLCFAGIYYLIGIEHLAGVDAGSTSKNFIEVFFFSAQTFTTVGYGRISPVGIMTNAVSTFEAFLGLLSFAIATGLFYGRFSRPQAFLQYSKNALISPYKSGKALMIRMAPYKNNNLSEAEVKVSLAMQQEENGQLVNTFYNLELEITHINSLSLSWTIVHPLNDKSPLNGLTQVALLNTKLEVLVFVKAFDEVFSNTVMSRHSYIAEEIKWGAKFEKMYYPHENKNKTVLDINRLNAYQLVSIEETS